MSNTKTTAASNGNRQARRAERAQTARTARAPNYQPMRSEDGLLVEIAQDLVGTHGTFTATDGTTIYEIKVFSGDAERRQLVRIAMPVVDRTAT